MEHDKFPLLRAYLRSLDVRQKTVFAVKCGTTLGYLRKFLCKGGGMDACTVSRLVTQSGGKIPAIELRPDVDWAALAKHLRPANTRVLNIPAQDGAVNASSPAGAA